MMQMEIRNDSVLIKGYANVTSRESRILNSPQGKFIEVVEQNTFKNAIDRNPNVLLLANHDKSRVLGKLSENVEMREDDIGLWVEATITDSEIIDKARNNKLSGYSFGFSCNECRFEDNADGIPRRFLSDINLYEVSILTSDKTPAYFATRVCEVRDSEDELIEERTIGEFEIIDNTDVPNSEEVEEVVEETHEERATDTEEEHLLLCHKHKIDTMLRIAKEKGEF